MQEQTDNNKIDKTEGNVPKRNAAVEFLFNILRGVLIGIAFIIPGFSGGSVAAILGIYEKLVGAIADIFKSFKKSVLLLAPILIGMLLGIGALMIPIKIALEHYPIPTVTLFVGLALGGLPSVTDQIKGGKPTWKHLVALAVPLVFAASLSFIPLSDSVDLFHLNFGGYLLLVLIGLVGSCALVIPGISGSMLLLIFGYYNPLVSLITDSLLHGQQVGVCLLVLFCTGIGLVIGFFLISKIMKYLLRKYPRGTYYSIVGFIVGSIPAVYVSTVRGSDASLSALYSSPWYWIIAVALLFLGIALSYMLVRYARKAAKKKM